MIRKTPPNLRANPKTCAAGCMHGVEAYEGEAYCKRYEVYTEATDVCDDWEPEEGGQDMTIKERANGAVGMIIRDLSDRRGLRQEWELIDDDIRGEIVQAWIKCVIDEFEGGKE